MEKKNTGLIIALTVFIMISIMACAYIGYDKFFAKNDIFEEAKENIDETKKKIEQKAGEVEKQEEYQSLAIDNEKCLGESCTEVEYSLFGEFTEYATVNVTGNTANIGFRNDAIKKLYGEDFNIDNSHYYNVNFSQNIQDVYISGFGQGIGEECILFLMEDGTVEYMRIYDALKNNNIKSNGKIEGVNDIVKFGKVSASQKNSPTGGYVSVIAQKANGEFYDLYSKVVK